MTLHTLRKSTALARCVLLWWCMALGVAVAAPWVQPVQHTLVCSASGSVTVQDTGRLIRPLPRISIACSVWPLVHRRFPSRLCRWPAPRHFWVRVKPRRFLRTA